MVAHNIINKYHYIRYIINYYTRFIYYYSMCFCVACRTDVGMFRMDLITDKNYNVNAITETAKNNNKYISKTRVIYIREKNKEWKKKITRTLPEIINHVSTKSPINYYNVSPQICAENRKTLKNSRIYYCYYFIFFFFHFCMLYA